MRRRRRNADDIIDLTSYKQKRVLGSAAFRVNQLINWLNSAGQKVPDLEPLVSELISQIEHGELDLDVLQETMERYTYNVHEESNAAGGTGSREGLQLLLAGTSLRRVVDTVYGPVTQEDDERIRAAWFQGWITGFGHGLPL